MVEHEFLAILYLATKKYCVIIQNMLHLVLEFWWALVRQMGGPQSVAGIASHAQRLSQSLKYFFDN